VKLGVSKTEVSAVVSGYKCSCKWLSIRGFIETDISGDQRVGLSKWLIWDSKLEIKMAEQAHSSSEVTEMGNKEEMQALLLKILNKMEDNRRETKQDLEQNRRETKQDIQDMVEKLNRRMDSLEESKKEMKNYMEKFREGMKNYIREECQKVREQIQEETEIMREKLNKKIDAELALVETIISQVREQVNQELVECKGNINAECKQMETRVDKELTDFNKVIMTDNNSQNR
jgi:hypothetical protein